MKTIKFLIQTTLVALATVWGSNKALANIDYTANASLTTDLEYVDFKIDGTEENGLAGAIHLTPVSGPQLVAVCTDVNAVIYLGSSYNFAVVPFASAGTGRLPSWGSTSANAQAALQKAAYIFDQNQTLLQTGTVSQKAGVQIAIWEALYDTTATGGLDLSAGRFQLVGSNDAAAIATANSILKSIPASFPTYDGYLLVPTVQNAQELLGIAVTDSNLVVTPVPEPSTVIAGALILIPFGISTLRIVRKNRV